MRSGLYFVWIYSNAHGSGWMSVFCKHWNWNWHWGWKYYIFLTRDVHIVWVTASIKLRDLLITWSRDKCKTLYLHFCNTNDHKTGQSSNLRWGDPTFKVTWRFDYVVTWHTKKTFICVSTTPMAAKLGRAEECSVAFSRW